MLFSIEIPIRCRFLSQLPLSNCDGYQTICVRNSKLRYPRIAVAWCLIFNLDILE